MPDFSQNFNRYSYCLNNPLKYVDPDGEWFGIDDLIVAGFSFFTGYVSNGISTGHWGWSSVKEGLISAGMGWLGYNMPGVSHTISSALKFSLSSAINTAANAILPSATLPIGNHFALSFSPLFGFSSGQLSIGIGTSLSYVNGAFNIQSGFGLGSNYYAWNISATYDGWGAGFGKTYYESGDFHGNIVGEQTVGNISLMMRSVSFRISNDLWGDHEDRWRTTAAELTIGKFSIGTFVLTNYGKEEGNGVNPNAKAPWPIGKNLNKKKGAWNNGVVYCAPLWFGYRRGNSIARFGISDWRVQNMTQNLVHKYPIGKANYYLGRFPTGPYAFYGFNNPFDLFNF